MNLFEFCDTFKVSLAKARRMEKAGVLRLDSPENAASDAIRHWLAQGQRLTVSQLCDLIESPAILLDLGRYAEAATQELAALGKAQEEAAPHEVVICIADAARGDREAVQTVMQWLFSVIPAREVTHAYLAVRLVLGAAPSVRKFEIGRAAKVFLNCRRQPEFAGWFTIKSHGSRTFSIYHKPKKPLAFLDL